MSAGSDARGRRRALLDFLVRLAVDPRALGAFLRDPESSAARAGLTRAERAILLSGDQNRLYAALAGRPARRGSVGRRSGR